jgi:epoxide hydrolase
VREDAEGFLYESAHSEEGWVPPSDVSQGMAVFNADPILRRVMDPQCTMGHWSEFDEGGHFPAMEVPDILVGDAETREEECVESGSYTRP